MLDAPTKLSIYIQKNSLTIYKNTMATYKLCMYYTQ
jgi:hypothetical protein